MLQCKTDSERNAAGQALIPTSVNLLEPIIDGENIGSSRLVS